MMQALQLSQTLKSVNLAGNVLTDATVKSISTHKHPFKSISKLNLTHNMINGRLRRSICRCKESTKDVEQRAL